MNEDSISYRAESHVIQFLEQQGWQILARNFRRVGSELDIIAMKKQTLIVVEVKWRRTPVTNWPDLERLVHKYKLASLKRGCRAFLLYEQYNPEVIRFDLAIVSPKPGPKWGIDYRVGIV